MAIKEVLMPSLGESVTEASVTKWLIKPGDKVKRYDSLMEVVSDKVIAEVPSDFTGVIKDILVDLDVTYPIGTALLTIEVEGEEAKTTDQVEKKEKVEIPSQPKNQNQRYSPSVIALAQEKNVDLSQVTGTGREGRVSRKDVLNYVASATPAITPQVTQPAKTEINAPALSDEMINTSEDHIVAADGIRKAIAKKMVQSSNEIPHAWVMVEADVSNIVALRNKIKNKFKEREGLSLSFFPFFVKAVAQAIKTNPKINTSWQDGNIVYHHDVNLSIAVTTENHLYVPVVKSADNYSVAGLAKEINRLATAVRTGTVKNEDMQKGTFTINNTGTLGSVVSMGIINYPQAAILQVESINKRLVIGKDNSFKVADMVNLCLSIDHRILDGQQAGNFLRDIKSNLARFNEESDIY